MKRFLIAAALAASLSACGSTPREQFYAFEPPHAPGAADGPLLVLKQVSVPELLQRPQLVLREGTRVTLLEQQRWAEPLASGVAQYLRARLQQLLPGWRVISREQQLRSAPGWEAQIDLHSMDLLAARGVQLSAMVQLQPPQGARQSQQHSLAQTCAGCEPAQLVAAQQQLLDQLAQQIAARVQGKAP
ncbi:PqiC family protein [Massilia sp. W12]|uniref:PqiC family protein n=1 Tax=Massilia sp. W12 TaxID=3126507 RepID=UPI0030D5688C